MPPSESHESPESPDPEARGASGPARPRLHGRPAPCERADRRREPRDDGVRRRRRDQAFALARAAEPHDPAIGGHLRRLNAVVAWLARAGGATGETAERLGDDAMLHDVGKLHVSAALLARAGPLDAAERAAVAQHTVLGEAFLRGRPGLVRAAAIARHHHEAWDGSGGPDGLAGEAIPFAARLTAVADVVDALRSPRPYKPPWPWPDVAAHLAALAGHRLDPAIAARAIAGLEDGGLAAAWETAAAEGERAA